MKNEQITSKGVYRFSQVNNFISVSNYIFMQQGEKNCLAIRFSNDTDYTFDSVSFCVIQFDALGKVIGKIRVDYTDMDFEPGTTYADSKGIAVDNNCVDFKIQFYEAYSGFYKYVVRNGKAIIYYDRDKADGEREVHSEEIASVSVKRKEYGKAKLTAFIAVLALLSIMVFNAYYLYSKYAEMFPDKTPPPITIENVADSDEGLCLGVEYAEI
jgi:hypothetical protein